MFYIAAVSFASCFGVIVAACWIACAEAPHAFSHSRGGRRRLTRSEVRKARQGMIGAAMIIGVLLLIVAAVSFAIATGALI